MISQSGQLSLSPQARVLPTNPQAPVIKTRMASSPTLTSRREPLPPGRHDFFHYVRQAARDVPIRIMRFHFRQVAVVADVIAAASLFDVGMPLFHARAPFGHRKGFQDR